MSRLFVVMVSCLLFSRLVFVEQLNAGALFDKPDVEIGSFFSAMTYEEPGFMKESGMMVGISAVRTWPDMHLGVFNTLRLEGFAGRGMTDYTSPKSGTIDGINNFLLETRALLGRDFLYNRSTELSIYSGFGYRRLADKSGGMISSEGYLGYDRRSQYLYLPVGFGVTTIMSEEWLLDCSIEYDLFLQGRQDSYLARLNNAWFAFSDNVTNHQSDGYGFRFITKFSNDNVTIAPYFRYWNIGESDKKPLSLYSYTESKTDQMTVKEPANHTTEYGFTISVIF